MPKRWCCPQLASLVLSVILLAACAGLAQSPITVETLLGSSHAGRFPSGASLALEIANGDGLIVHRVALFAGERLIYEETLAPSLGVELWLGELALVDVDGCSLASGEYSLVAFTCSGAIVSTLDVTSDLGATCGEASPSSDNPRLEIYLLLDEDAASEGIEIRNGEKILIALAGNPTTGYEWIDTTENLFPILEPIAGSNYIAHPTTTPIAGGGGRFLFRYRAFSSGSQVLGFMYARPWESVQPAKRIVFAVGVI